MASRSSLASFASPLAALALAGLAGCAPGKASPTVMALLDPGTGALTPTPVVLQTVTDPVGMVGGVARFQGGARIVVDPADPNFYYGSVPDDRLDEVFVKDKGGSVHASYFEKDGVLWPADFHTWNLTTAYFHFERAFNYFQEMGVASEELGAAPVYYFPDFVMGDASRPPQKDNAFFFGPVHGFLLLPFESVQQVPFALNAGALAHEYGHLVFSSRVYQNAAVPQAFRIWGPSGVARPSNVLKSVDEGLADFHAYGATCRTARGCDPRFFAPTLPPAIVDARDLSRTTQCLTTDQRQLMDLLSTDQFLNEGRHYVVGSALAASLYQAGERTGQREVLLRAVLLAYTDPTPASPGIKEQIADSLYAPQRLTLEGVSDAILSHIGDPDLRKATCDEMLARLKLNRDLVPSCPLQSAAVADCSEVL